MSTLGEGAPPKKKGTGLSMDRVIDLWSPSELYLISKTPNVYKWGRRIKNPDIIQAWLLIVLIVGLCILNIDDRDRSVTFGQ